MALEQKYYSLKNVSFVLGSGLVADAITVGIKRTIHFAERKAGRSGVMQRVIVHEDAEINVEGWNSDDRNFAAITPGTGITAMTLDSDDDATTSFLHSDFLTKFPVSGWAFGDTETELKDEPSTWKTQILPNVLNVPATGGE